MMGTWRSVHTYEQNGLEVTLEEDDGLGCIRNEGRSLTSPQKSVITFVGFRIALYKHSTFVAEIIREW